MKQLIRRVRINDRIPTMMHNDMHINEAYYDDIVIVRDGEGGTPFPPAPIYTPVTEVKMTNPVNNDYDLKIYLDTGIEIQNTQSYWCETELTAYGNNGNTVIGLDALTWLYATGWQPGNSYGYFFRLFSYDNRSIVFDYARTYNGYLVSAQRIKNFTFNSNAPTKIEWGKNSNGNMCYIKDNSSTSTQYSSNTFDYDGCAAANNLSKKIFINICSHGFRYLKIWSDYTKTTLLFDGIAVIDNNNDPGVYDSVSNTIKYFDLNGSTVAGTVTYIQ